MKSPIHPTIVNSRFSLDEAIALASCLYRTLLQIFLMMTNHITTCFEDLPNELIYEIFSYIDALKLYQTFLDLNIRINAILDNISNLSFQLSTTDANNPLIDRFARRIDYLSIPEPNTIDATRFLNVRSLQFFDFLSQERLIQVRHLHFPRLIYLRMCYIEDSAIASAFFQMVFSNKFPSLCKCIMDEIIPSDVYYRWSSSPTLRSLTVNGFGLPTYAHILTACSNLNYLHWSTIQYTDEDMTVIPLRHTQLKRLYIRTINIEKIEIILKYVPNLKRLHIVSDWSRGNNCLPLNFKQLAHILIQYVPNLYRFDCETLERNPRNDIDTIRALHHCFVRIQSEQVPDGRTRFFTSHF